MENIQCHLIDIKSNYILKKIFYNINIIMKLELIKYNKLLQKREGLELEDYKKKSGRIKRGGKNGKGTEFILYKNILIFEGEYLNGKKKIEKEKNIIIMEN